MPRYHFNVHDGKDIPDTDGAELADLDAARVYAAQYASALLREQMEAFWKGDKWHIDVTDHRGLALFTLTFSVTNSSARSR